MMIKFASNMLPCHLVMSADTSLAMLMHVTTASAAMSSSCVGFLIIVIELFMVFLNWNVTKGI
jgi:hypothetical protein